MSPSPGRKGLVAAKPELVVFSQTRVRGLFRIAHQRGRNLELPASFDRIRVGWGEFFQ